MRNDPGASPGAFMPEFVTRALFEPLNVPEVEFDLPFDTGQDDARLPVARALREAVPGRVSRRYGYQRDEHRAWIPLPDAGRQTIELDDAAGAGRHARGPLVPAWAARGRDRSRPPVPDQAAAAADDEVSSSSQGSPRWAHPGRSPRPGPAQRR